MLGCSSVWAGRGATWARGKGNEKNFRAPLAPPYVWPVAIDPWQLSGPGGQGGGGGESRTRTEKMARPCSALFFRRICLPMDPNSYKSPNPRGARRLADTGVPTQHRTVTSPQAVTLSGEIRAPRERVETSGSRGAGGNRGGKVSSQRMGLGLTNLPTEWGSVEGGGEDTHSYLPPSAPQALLLSTSS